MMTIKKNTHFLQNTFSVSKSTEDTFTVAQHLINNISESLSDTDRKSAVIITLSGNLGSGKTTFAQGIAQALHIEDRVTSPTYMIMKMYETSHHLFKTMVHMDAYRLSSGKELEMLGWKRIVDNPELLLVIEWPENVLDILPSTVISIILDPINATTRNIEING